MLQLCLKASSESFPLLLLVCQHRKRKGIFLEKLYGLLYVSKRSIQFKIVKAVNRY